MGELFGTDGARGIAISSFTCETAMQIGRAVAAVFCKGAQKPKIIIGLDTRVSAEVIQSALVSGICSMGADAVIVGVVPTPAVAVPNILIKQIATFFAAIRKKHYLCKS